MSDNSQKMSQRKTIWVFKTSVVTHLDVRRLKPILDRLMNEGDKWNFDLEDIDHILRVETHSLPASTFIDTIHQAGYTCAELEDIMVGKIMFAKNEIAYNQDMLVTVSR